MESDFDDITCVVLTGMGRDGTVGIKQLNDKRNIYVIGQNAATCTVYGMPRSLEESGLADEVVPLDEVANAIIKNVGVRYGVNLELQNLDMHYLIDPSDAYCDYYRRRNLPHQKADAAIHSGPFLKIGIYGDIEHREEGSEMVQKAALFDQIEAQLRQMLDDSLVVLRATPQIINIHSKAASKYLAARNLKEKLGKKILVCVGDEGNDVPMLEGADYAFCPCDGAVADQFPNVGPCSLGAVADVIYEKLPEILKG